MGMILVDAVHINNGGGKILLDYLIMEIEREPLLNVYYLLDLRIKDNTPVIKFSNHVLFIKGTLWNRMRFYIANKDKFETILCFGNLPPAIRINANVYTYFHNTLYLKTPSSFSSFQRILYLVKSLILKISAKNTDVFLVQSVYIKNGIISKYKQKDSKVAILPFYPPFPDIELQKKQKNCFIYVSNANPNKNHIRLINAFCHFYEIYKTGELILTVAEEFSEVFTFIKSKQLLGYPINNMGFVSREKLKYFYLKAEYLIFPSLSESFGLGIVEAIENGCKVIGADLPYTYEVCEPSLTFNPYSEDEIRSAIKQACFNKLEESKSLINNKIEELISLLTNGNKK